MLHRHIEQIAIMQILRTHHLQALLIQMKETYIFILIPLTIKFAVIWRIIQVWIWAKVIDYLRFLTTNSPLKRNIVNTITLESEFKDMNDKVFTPKFKQSRSTSKISKIKPLNRPYHLRSPDLKLNQNKGLNVINFQTINENSPLTSLSEGPFVRLSLSFDKLNIWLTIISFCISNINIKIYILINNQTLVNIKWNY